jgi:hypothetical protein
MTRRARSIVGGYAYHGLNRANGRLRLLRKEADFAPFEQVIADAQGWCDYVNDAQTEAELAAIRRCVAREQPFGGDQWRAKVARQLGLEHSFRPRGSPRKSGSVNSDSKNVRH